MANEAIQKSFFLPKNIFNTVGKKFTRQRIKIFLAFTGPPKFLASVIFGKFFGTNHFHGMDPRDAGRSKILGEKMSHDQKIGKIKS